jgi:hypothetical protein
VALSVKLSLEEEKGADLGRHYQCAGRREPAIQVRGKGPKDVAGRQACIMLNFETERPG